MPRAVVSRGHAPVDEAMTNDEPKPADWSVVVNANHLQLSAIDPPDARVPGPIIGPDSRVRPCGGVLPASDFGVICLDVDVAGQVERGYTIRKMVALASDPMPPPRVSPFAIATPMVLVLVVALILVFV
jgi:hypothetical protein